MIDDSQDDEIENLNLLPKNVADASPLFHCNLTSAPVFEKDIH